MFEVTENHVLGDDGKTHSIFLRHVLSLAKEINPCDVVYPE